MPNNQPVNIVLTGGTRGIGKYAVAEFLQNKANIVTCARHLPFSKLPNTVFGFEADLGNPSEVDRFANFALENLKKIDILVLNAAVPGIKEDDDYTRNVNYEAQKQLVESISESLRSSSGRILFLTSSQASRPIEDNLAYGLSKRDFENWLKLFSLKPENQNIQSIIINPGPTDTQMHEQAIHYGNGETRRRSLEIKNNGNLRNPDIIGKIVAKIALTGRQFDPETGKYDLPILPSQVVYISEANIEFEQGCIEKELIEPKLAMRAYNPKPF